MKNTFRKTYILIGICALTLALIQCNEKTASSDFNKFTGRWKLHKIQLQDTITQNWTDVLGNNKDRKGFIIYDGLGGMGVHHVTENYENFEFEGKGNLDSLTKRDLRHFTNNFVYFGKYNVNDINKTIEHHIESHIYPKSWGSIAKREYKFKGDTLILSPLNKDLRLPIRIIWISLNDTTE